MVTVVLNVGRSGAVVERLLSAAAGSEFVVCSIASVDGALRERRRWRPDCWICDGESLPGDPEALEAFAEAVAESPLFVHGSSPPPALPDRLDVRRVTSDTVVEDVLAVVDGDGRTDALPSDMLLSAFGRSDDLVASLDRDGTYRFVSEELASLFDAPSSRVVGATLDDHTPVGDAEALREHGVRAIETGTIQRHETDGHRCRFVPEGDDRFRLIVQRSADSPAGQRDGPVADFVDDVLDRLTDIFFVMDLEGRFLHWNDRLVEVTGHTDGEIASMSAMEFFVAEDYDRVAAAVAEVLETGDATEIIRLRTRDGRLLPHEFTGSTIRDRDGQPRYICGIARGLSRRQHAERALRERQQALPNLIRNLPGVVSRYRNEPGFPVDFISQGCADLTGYPFESIENGDIPWVDTVVHPDDRDRVRERMAEAAADGERYQSIYRIRTAGDDVRWVWEQGASVDASDGPAAYLDSYLTDITDVVRIQRELRRERAFTESALDAQPDLFYVFTPDGEMLRWNDRFTEVTGYTDDEIASMHPIEFVADDDSEAVLEAIERVLDGERMLTVEATLVTREGRRIPYEFVGSAMRDGDEWLDRYGAGEVHICGTGRDISQRVRAEAELEEAISELERSNDALERFAYVASHDLKEPLRMIQSYLDLLQRRYEGELDDDADEFIAYATDGAERMRGMIDDLLTYSRIGTSGAEFDAVDCEDVVDRVLENLRVAVEDTDAEIDVGPLPTAVADEQQLVQLFQNLIGNALAYASDDPRIRVSAVETDDGWRFSVSDNGVGIPEERSEEVFEVFSSGSNGADSTGVGLAICRRIVARHGGEIWVDSEPGVGSTFHFTLPDRDRGESSDGRPDD